MITLGEIFRRYGPAYREKFGDHLPASHRAAMAAIEPRTDMLAIGRTIAPEDLTEGNHRISSNNCVITAVARWLAVVVRCV